MKTFLRSFHQFSTAKNFLSLIKSRQFHNRNVNLAQFSAKNFTLNHQNRRFLSSSSQNFVDENSIIKNVIKIEDDESSALKQVIDEITASSSLIDEAAVISSIGGGRWTPAGLVRLGLGGLQQATGLPWWEVIMIGVVVGRLALMPFTIASVRYADRMRHHREPMAKLSQAMMQAQKSGDTLKTQALSTAYFNYMRTHGLNPLGPFMKILPMSVFFTSFYFALKSMAAANLPSMKSGGMLWFTDLTVPDPIFLLPVLCAGLLSATFKVGAEVEFIPPQTPGVPPETFDKILNIVFPLGILAVTPWFSSALLVYWCTSNFVSLILAATFRTSKVREMLKLRPLKKKL